MELARVRRSLVGGPAPDPGDVADGSPVERGDLLVGRQGFHAGPEVVDLCADGLDGRRQAGSRLLQALGEPGHVGAQARQGLGQGRQRLERLLDGKFDARQERPAPTPPGARPCRGAPSGRTGPATGRRPCGPDGPPRGGRLRSGAPRPARSSSPWIRARWRSGRPDPGPGARSRPRWRPSGLRNPGFGLRRGAVRHAGDDVVEIARRPAASRPGEASGSSSRARPGRPRPIPRGSGPPGGPRPRPPRGHRDPDRRGSRGRVVSWPRSRGTRNTRGGRWPRTEPAATARNPRGESRPPPDSSSRRRSFCRTW